MIKRFKLYYIAQFTFAYTEKHESFTETGKKLFACEIMH